MGAAREVVQTYYAAVEANRGFDIPDKNLINEFEAAKEKKRVAAGRMKDIEWEINPLSRWHQQVSWRAEDYFDDPKVIKLCRAVEENDIEEMERLIASGADVKSVGKDGMTPLMWAFPDHKPERFACLLKHGADPNVFFESDFGVENRHFHPDPTGDGYFNDRGCHAGQSVTHLACRSPVIKYMQLVFSRGGDANLVDKKTKQTPLDMVVERGVPDARQRVEILIESRADVNRFCEYEQGSTRLCRRLTTISTTRHLHC